MGLYRIFYRMAPISMPVLIAGLFTTLFLERFKVFGYGAQLPERVRDILQAFDDDQTANLTDQVKAKLLVQLIVGLILMFSLAFSIAAVGLIGLMIIILLTSFTGIIEEKELGKAFEEALPFTALLVVFLLWLQLYTINIYLSLLLIMCFFKPWNFKHLCFL